MQKKSNDNLFYKIEIFHGIAIYCIIPILLFLLFIKTNNPIWPIFFLIDLLAPFIHLIITLIIPKRINEFFKTHSKDIKCIKAEVVGFKFFTPRRYREKRMWIVLKFEDKKYYMLNEEIFNIGDLKNIYIIKNSKYKYAIDYYYFKQIKNKSH